MPFETIRSPTRWMFYVFCLSEASHRLLCCGLSSVVVPIYLAENTIQKLRGRVIMLNQAALTFGQFLSGITAGIFSHIEVDSWRYLLGVILIPSVLQFVGFLWLPESSRYLVKKGKISEAQEVMHSLWKQSSKKEMKFLVASKGTDDETQNTSIHHNLKCIMMTPTVRRALLVACSLRIVNQFSGINVIIFYSSIVMKMSGIKDDSVAIWLSTIPVLTNFLFSFVGFYLIERIGRRRLLFLSTIGVIISLVFLSVVFWRIDKTSPALSVHEQDSNSSHCVTHSLCSECVSDLSCGFCYIDNPTEGAINGSCLPTSIVASHHASIGRCNASSLREPTSEVSWTYNFCPSSLILFALIGQVLYIMSFASGLGPLPWAIGAEVFPTWARSLCNSIVTATLWLCSLLLTGTFLTMTQTFTTYGTFILMSIISSIGLVFWYIHLPETKGNSLEETELLFSKPFCSCCG